MTALPQNSISLRVVSVRGLCSLSRLAFFCTLLYEELQQHVLVSLLLCIVLALSICLIQKSLAIDLELA